MVEKRDEFSLYLHDEGIINTWNKFVKPEDTVFHLGDFSLKKPPVINQWISRLNGTVHLITGNHDSCFPGIRDYWKYQQSYIDAGFATVSPFARVRFGKAQVMLSHFPYNGDGSGTDRYTQYRLQDEFLPVIHGHTHSIYHTSYSNQNTLQIHVGWDAWRRPVSDGEIWKILQDHGILE